MPNAENTFKMLQDFLHQWQNFRNPRKIESSLIHRMWICLEFGFFWLPPQGFPSLADSWMPPGLEWALSQCSQCSQTNQLEPNKPVKIPPPKTPRSLLCSSSLPKSFNLQDPSYFNPTEKDWCFGVVLGYIKIHISNKKCLPFIQPSLFSMEPNFQAVSSTFQEYEAPFSSCANAVMPPIIYV